jgi:hypothetical protein
MDTIDELNRLFSDFSAFVKAVIGKVADCANRFVASETPSFKLSASRIKYCAFKIFNADAPACYADFGDVRDCFDRQILTHGTRAFANLMNQVIGFRDPRDRAAAPAVEALAVEPLAAALAPAEPLAPVEAPADAGELLHRDSDVDSELRQLEPAAGGAAGGRAVLAPPDVSPCYSVFAGALARRAEAVARRAEAAAESGTGGRVPPPVSPGYCAAAGALAERAEGIAAIARGVEAGMEAASESSSSDEDYSSEDDVNSAPSFGAVIRQGIPSCPSPPDSPRGDGAAMVVAFFSREESGSAAGGSGSAGGGEVVDLVTPSVSPKRPAATPPTVPAEGKRPRFGPTAPPSPRGGEGGAGSFGGAAAGGASGATEDEVSSPPPYPPP